jgi:hypothetical protein
MMTKIRLKKTEWGKAWRAMVEIAPVRLVRDDPVYEVEPAHLELLTRLGFSYEILPDRKRTIKRATQKVIQSVGNTDYRG